MSQFHYQKDDNNVVAVTMDMEGPVNLMNESFAPLLAETVAKLEAEEQLAGVILGSAKKTFFQLKPVASKNFSKGFNR